MEQFNQDSQSSGFYAPLIVGILIGLAAGYLFFGGKSEQSAAKTQNPGAPVVSETNRNSVEVFAQEAGATVKISKVTLQATGWVAIHEDDGGKPGLILGAQLFDPGENSGEVTLLRGTAPQKTYYAALRTDDGDRKFNLKTDAPITDGDEAIAVSFQTLEYGVPIRNESAE